MFRTYGPHKVSNCDVFKDDWLAMIEGEKFSVLYSDPPWGDGNMKYWCTMNRKMTGEEHIAHSYQELVDRFMQFAKRVTRYMGIETGLKFTQPWHDALSKEFPYLITKKLVYSSNNIENILLLAGREPIPDIPCDGMKGYIATKTIVSALAEPGAIIIDPCCGMGYTAQAAIDTGMIFRGNEFNAARLAKTEARLRKAVKA